MQSRTHIKGVAVGPFSFHQQHIGNHTSGGGQSLLKGTKTGDVEPMPFKRVGHQIPSALIFIGDDQRSDGGPSALKGAQHAFQPHPVGGGSVHDLVNYSICSLSKGKPPKTRAVLECSWNLRHPKSPV